MGVVAGHFITQLERAPLCAYRIPQCAGQGPLPRDVRSGTPDSQVRATSPEFHCVVVPRGGIQVLRPPARRASQGTLSAEQTSVNSRAVRDSSHDLQHRT